MTATAASGHITGSVSHVLKQMKRYFFTKSQSDARYYNVGERLVRVNEAKATWQHRAGYGWSG
jgi:hypothetical protein